MNKKITHTTEGAEIIWTDDKGIKALVCPVCKLLILKEELNIVYKNGLKTICSCGTVLKVYTK